MSTIYMVFISSNSAAYSYSLYHGVPESKFLLSKRSSFFFFLKEAVGNSNFLLILGVIWIL